MKTIVIVIPDGVGIRNFVYSGLVESLIKSNYKVVLWSVLEQTVFDIDTTYLNNIKFEKLFTFKETRRSLFYRKLITYIRLLFNKEIANNQTIMNNWIYPKNIKNIFFYKIIEIIGIVLSNYKWLLKLEKIYHKQIMKSNQIDSFVDFLQKENPICVINTNQRNVNALMPMLAAKKLNIPTSTAIFSWDNLPKANLVTKVDKYFVWSDYMAWELGRYYPEIPNSSIFVTGTPQFSFYKQKKLYLSKKDFCKRYGFDLNKAIICFSGDDEMTSPDDPLYLSDLAEVLQQIDKKDRPQILFRRCPVDLSGRYQNVLIKYADDIIVVDPLWKKIGNQWNTVYPTFEDIQLLVNVALHCELVYNVGSSMALDFAMLDKPACYINYDINNKDWSVDKVYRYEHFRTMVGLDAVVWINNKQEIDEKILLAINEPNNVAVDRKKWLNKVIKDIDAIDHITQLSKKG